MRKAQGSPPPLKFSGIQEVQRSPRPERFQQGDHAARVIGVMARHDRLRFISQGRSALPQNASGGIDRRV